MRVLLLHLDGSLPNLALMRIAAHHRSRGDEVELRRAEHPARIAPQFGDSFERVYASAIFSESRPLVREVQRQWPGAIIGGTGADERVTLQDAGISTLDTDYADYPACGFSMGFVFRGCRLKCSFCCVPQKEGEPQAEQTIGEIWRGDPARRLLLLDNDFGGHPTWRARAREIIDGKFRVSFFQGINARLLDQELAEALAAMDLRDGRNFAARRVYTAWDNRRDERILFRGLDWLTRAGIKPDSIMVYMLIGYCHQHRAAAYRCPAGCQSADTQQDREHRRRQLRAYGVRPFPMAYVDDETPREERQQLKGFQRWVIRRADLMIEWEEYMGADYRPEKVRRAPALLPLFEEAEL